MPLLVLKHPPLKQSAASRLEAASRNSPALKYGECNSDGVRALQNALLLLADPRISISDGATGNYLNQTVAAVKAFQTQNGLISDGIAGQRTITLLDALLAKRAQRSLQTLDRALGRLRHQYGNDAARAKILQQMEQAVQGLRSGNDLGLALALPVIAIIVVFFFMLMWLSLPQSQAALRELMRRTIEAVNERGEVAQEKLQELKKEIDRFLAQATEIKTDCMEETLLRDPKKHADCLRRFKLKLAAAHQALIRTLNDTITVIFDSLGRGRLRFPNAVLLRNLATAFKGYMDAVNDLLSCMECPEIPFPQFPSNPDFPF
ncbi:peptidoglycan-binding domain-containing protein [Paludisphaera borealis]|uniref:Peptidoglycan binding-like domain-containing protein n=1 Tax=Paludisphaera borealis TaxID=1387353 RepID=A0A1U7CWS8_9BACT|nr:peptidoglycan-binding protein [Paludisphaera borealis]APW63402.1 hypothetical protein BSF38_04969 [Paludisphaera borealis]